MLTETYQTQRAVHPAFHQPEESPEKRLFLAVLQDALATFQRGLNSAVRQDLETFREVDWWFRNRDYDSPFAFESICAALGIEASCVRDALNRLRLTAFADRGATIDYRVSRKRVYTRRAWSGPLG